MKLKPLLLVAFLLSLYTAQAQKTFLRPIGQSSLMAIHPGMMIGNYTSHLGLNFQHGQYAGQSLIATYGEHNRKIGGSYVFEGEFDNNTLGIQTKSISGAYAYRILLNRKNVI